MKPPLYLFLPVVGAMVLVAAVVGTSLWPEAPLPEVSFASTPRPPPPPVPQAAPAPPRPAAKPIAARPKPAPAPLPPPAPLPLPVEPPERIAEVAMPPRNEAPQQDPADSVRREPYSDQKERVVERPWMGKSMERIAQRLGEDEARLERERQEAQGRGDTAELQRLETRIELNRKRIGIMRSKFPAYFEEGKAPAPLQ
ncbi:hypothetical protein [Stigmatella aurantiaca]|uniref:Uncharacterized protein n=1 Tax=Stigmatella aurantiaca (strain DW4/3-1) TaxID=378806 RepID=Q097W2_STIAD|nr:hypothetical protein [Stigmatella aurantiaca]ADO68460.1 uncharacterized protein STAUR_0656 [Stigmatella aurantiaca DW4/3-1]EAU68026.1 hypothetical protein STIAU_0792 [Stigmatella aurantiaca DW4/3-1]